MSNVLPSSNLASFRAACRRAARLVALLLAVGPLEATGVAAADLSTGDAPNAAPPSAAGGGGYWAPLIPLRPAPTRFDIYGYPILGPGLLGRPAPHTLGVGCPLALEPAYDPDGNLAGYAPLQYCR